MAINKHKPTSPARRFATWLDARRGHALASPRSRSSRASRKTGGRNTHGRITSRHRGGGAKRRYRRDRLQAPQGRRAGEGRRDRVRPEPQRAHRAAALPRRREALHPRAAAADGRHGGRAPARAPRSRSATRLPLARIPTGTVVHNVELTPGRGGQLGRSAGAAIQLVAKEGTHATLRLPSGEMRMVPAECRATIGTIGNADHENVSIGKAGPQPPQGHPAADARHRDEPGRPPARRRRGQDHRRAPPGHALGRADARLPHPQEGQAVRQVHRARPPPREARR